MIRAVDDSSAWRVVRSGRHALAEGPAWDPLTGTLLWVDIPGRRVIRSRLEGDALDESRVFDESVGFVLPAASGGAVVGVGRRLCALAADLAPRGLVVEVAAADPIRINDASVDPQGRLVFGTMDPLKRNPGRAEVRRLEADGSTSTLATGFTISNGIGWSPDGKRIYLTDSTPHAILVGDYDGSRLILSRFATDADGQPDGLAVDALGCVWSASYGGGVVKRYDPEGELMEVHPVPGARPAGLAFAGVDRRTLVVTLAYGDTEATRPVVIARETAVAGVPVPEIASL
ncbi:MAG: SMP-30/gluconolactonase/LRE family protein [Microbacterium sp.]